MKKIRKKLSDNSEAEKKTLVIIYFAGHGVMLKNENNIAVLETDEKKRYYGLECSSRALSDIPRSYIITVFDCCREYVTPPKKEDRGLGDMNTDTKQDSHDKLHSIENFI